MKQTNDTIKQLQVENAMLRQEHLRLQLCYENMIPIELANNVCGDTPEEMRKNAELISRHVSVCQAPEPTIGEQIREGLNSLALELESEREKEHIKEKTQYHAG